VAGRTGYSWSEPTSAPETCVQKVLLGFFSLSRSDTFNVFGPLSLYSITLPSVENLGHSLLYEFCCGQFEIIVTHSNVRGKKKSVFTSARSQFFLGHYVS